MKFRLLADKGRADFWFFLKYVLRNPVLYGPLHRPIAKWASDWSLKRKKMLLMSRGHVKSNVVSVALPLWEIVRDKNIRILLYSHKDKDSLKFMRAIQESLRSPFFNACYPDIGPVMDRGREKVWNASALLIERDKKLVENTIEISSRDATIVGRHYDLMIMDDLVTDTNTATVDQIEQTAEDHKLLESLLDPGARELVTGTRYNFADEYGRILDTPDLANSYDIKTIPFMSIEDRAVFEQRLSGTLKWDQSLDDKYLAYPTRFTLADDDIIYDGQDGKDSTKDKKSLVATFKMQGSSVFSNQYWLEPHDPSRAAFRESDLRIIHTLPDDRKLTHFRDMDLSSEMATATSFTAIISACHDERGNIYIYHIFWGQFDGPEICRELIRGQEVEEKARPVAITAERGPYERALRPFLDRMAMERGIFVPVAFLPSNQGAKTKDDRIIGLQPWFRSGKINVLASCPNIEMLISEMKKFPLYPLKDILDALSQFPHIVFPGSKDFLNDPVPEAEVVKCVGDEHMAALAHLGKKRGITIGNDRVTQKGILTIRGIWN